MSILLRFMLISFDDCLCVAISIQVSSENIEVRFPGAGVSGHGELTDKVSGTGTPVLQEGSKPS